MAGNGCIVFVILLSPAQGIVSDMVSQIFGIAHGYHGQVLSNFARLNMSDAVEESNEKHLAPWSQACSASEIHNTPLTPYIDKAGGQSSLYLMLLKSVFSPWTHTHTQELLYNRHLHVNGTKIESTGFSYAVAKISVELLREVRGALQQECHCTRLCFVCPQVVDDYVKSGLFPASLFPS